MTRALPFLAWSIALATAPSLSGCLRSHFGHSADDRADEVPGPARAVDAGPSSRDAAFKPDTNGLFPAPRPAVTPVVPPRSADPVVDARVDARVDPSLDASVSGAGPVVCASGLLRCADECFDPKLDSAHCGSCGNACGAEQACRDASCVVATSDWPTFGADMARSGYNPRERGTPPLTPSWSVSLIQDALNPVMVEGTRVFASGRTRFRESGPLFALDVQTGAKLWTRDFLKVSSVGQPTVVEGRVYLQTSSGIDFPSKLWVLRSDSGEEVWSSTFASQWENFWSPTVTPRGVYVNAGSYSGLWGFRRSSGVPLFTYSELAQFDEWSAASDGRNLYSFVEGKLRNHDLETGSVRALMSVKWNWAGWSMLTSPVLARSGVVYVIAPPTLYAFEPATQKLLWSVASNMSSMPALAEGKLLAYDSQLLNAFDANTGALLWRCSEAEALQYPPVAAHGYAYVASDVRTYAIELATGKVVWKAEPGGWLSVGAGKLFIAAADGILRTHALTPATP